MSEKELNPRETNLSESLAKTEEGTSLQLYWWNGVICSVSLPAMERSAICSVSLPARRRLGRRAFCAALQDELTKYYKLLAVLEVRAMNPIPLVFENANSGNYLSLMRLSVWFAEPVVKMKLMAMLVDSCKVLKGGAMAGAIHLHAQHEDPMVNEFMKRLLKRVCSPLFEMVRSWVLEGELEDMFSE